MKILVVGDVGLDKYTHGTVDRISPEAPVPVVQVTRIEYRLGMAANVANNLVAMGSTPILVGQVGIDSMAQILSTHLTMNGVGADYIIAATPMTIVKERILTDQQQIVRVDYEIVDPTEKSSKATEAMCSLVLDSHSISAIVIQDYAKGCITKELVLALCEAGKYFGIPVIVDPNPKHPLSLYYGCSLIIPNKKEAESLVGFPLSSKEKVEEAARCIAEQVGCKWVVIKLGKDGMAAFDGQQTLFTPTVARNVFDVSGAGDTAVSALAIEMAGGNDFFHAVHYANLAAGLSVGKQGTSTVTKTEIEAAKESIR